MGSPVGPEHRVPLPPGAPRRLRAEGGGRHHYIPSAHQGSITRSGFL